MTFSADRSKARTPYRSYLIDGLILFALTAVYCLHYYHGKFVFQGDVFLNLYMHGNPALFKGGWDPYAWGYSGWYPAFGGFFPLNYLMHYLLEGGSPLAALRLLQANAAASLFLLSFFTCVFFRHLGISRGGAVLGAVIVSFTGFHVHMGVREFDLFYIHSFMFVPLVLMFLSKAEKERELKWALLSGLFIGLSLLGGGSEPMFMYAPAFIFIYMISRNLKGAFSPSGLFRSASYAAVAIAVGLLVGAASVIPSLKYTGLSSRSFYLTPFIENKGLSMAPLYTLLTSVYRNWWPGSFDLYFHELDSFIGIPAVILMLLGFFRGGGASGRWFMLFLGVFAAASMHIAYMPASMTGPWEFYLSALSMRLPYRFFMVFLLPAAYFASCGYDGLIKRAAGLTERVFLAIAGALIVAYGYYASVFWGDSMPAELKSAFFSAFLITVFFYVILSLRAYKPGYAVLGRFTGGAMVALLFLFYFFSHPDTPLRKNYVEKDIRFASPWGMFQNRETGEVVDFFFEGPKRLWGPVIKAESSPFRIYNPGVVLRGNLWAPKNQIDIAFEPADDPAMALSFNRYFFSGPANDINSTLYDLYNVKYLRLDRYSGDKYIATPVEGIYKNPFAFERFFITHGVRYFPTIEYMFQSLGYAERNDLRENIYLPSDRYEHVGYSVTGEAEEVRVIERSARRVVLEVKMAGWGHIVASELWFPAWKVKVDGRKKTLLRAYGTFWGVELDRGTHRVEFRFFDIYALMGKIISGISLLALAAAPIYLRIKSKRGL